MMNRTRIGGMITSLAPMRLDLAGGGTDLLSYARNKGGVVINAAVAIHCVCRFSRREDDLVSLRTGDLDFTGRRSDLLPFRDLVRFIVARYGADGMDISLETDVPKGSGLGGSGAVGVALLKGLAEFNPRIRTSSPTELAELAARIEIFELGAPIGKQDQYASAFGGINRMDFHRDDSVTVSPLRLQKDTLNRLSENLMLFHLGRTRESSAILTEQSTRSGTHTDAIAILDRLKSLAVRMAESLTHADLEAFADHLGEVWSIKKHLSPGITDPRIDSFYDAALKGGAVSGKIIGAGGGGCFLLYAPPETRPGIRDVLSRYREIPFEISETGCRILETG